jgi:hypothetical protein
MEVILGAADFAADKAERYGWVNRALPDAELDAFVARLATYRVVPCRCGAIDQAGAQRTDPARRRRDPRRRPTVPATGRLATVKARVATLFAQGLQTRGQLELDLGDRIESL